MGETLTTRRNGGNGLQVDWRAAAIVVSLFLFLAGHLGTALWFAARLTTQVEQIQRDVRDMKDSFKAVEDTVKKRGEDAARRDERIRSISERLQRVEDGGRSTPRRTDPD